MRIATLPLATAGFTLLVLLAAPAAAQQRIGHVDSNYILERVPEYQTAQQQMDRLAQQWRSQLDELTAEIQEMEREFASRELLYTEDERERRRSAINDRRREQEALRVRFFGPEGELFREQNRLMRPIQERVLEAIEEVAREGNLDYVFDKSGDYVFLFARNQLDLSDRVLEELGIDAARAAGR
jgi:outer membrane protein